jgi:hypothetical protein
MLCTARDPPREHFPGFVNEFPTYHNTDFGVFENRKVQRGLSRGAGHVARMQEFGWKT